MTYIYCSLASKSNTYWSKKIFNDFYWTVISIFITTSFLNYSLRRKYFICLFLLLVYLLTSFHKKILEVHSHTRKKMEQIINKLLQFFSTLHCTSRLFSLKTYCKRQNVYFLLVNFLWNCFEKKLKVWLKNVILYEFLPLRLQFHEWKQNCSNF